MRFGVFAAGAVGGYFGGRLAEAGEDVAFVARGENLRALRERGLRVESVAGDVTIHLVNASDDPADIGPVDCVLVAVKTWHLPEAAVAMRPMLEADTVVVPLLNGVEAPAILADALGKEHVIGGLCRLFVSLAGPGHVRHTGFDPSVHFGELDGSYSGRVERLLKAFGRARGVTAAVPDDILAALWEKLLFVEPTGAVGAVTRAPIGVFRSVPETRALLESAMREVREVALARGVTVAEEAVDRASGFVDALMASGTASMQRDIMEGRPSELEGQTGSVVRLARESGVPVPAHEMLLASLLPLERLARGEIEPPGP
ncbi:MAG: 2-dehydropantoate 2-reductase [Actinomycetota bacterium]